MAPRIRSLHRYPVKSLRGLASEHLEIGARGPHLDREWMVVDPGDRFVTQRELPELARVAVRLEGERLTLSTAGRDPLVLDPVRDGPRRSVLCWRDRCESVDQGDAAAAWLSASLGRPLRLVRMAPDFERRVNPRRSPEPAHTGFADGYPFLIVAAESLDALNEHLDPPLPADRFRPNVVVEGGLAWEEDRWRRIRVGSLVLDVVKPCERCAITTTDQYTGERGREPLPTLARLRRSEAGVLFGVNAVHRGEGRLRVGDLVEVLERGPEPTWVAPRRGRGQAP